MRRDATRQIPICSFATVLALDPLTVHPYLYLQAHTERPEGNNRSKTLEANSDRLKSDATPANCAVVALYLSSSHVRQVGLQRDANYYSHLSFHNSLISACTGTPPVF